MISLSGSSLSRNRNCAITMLATSSLISVPRKTMRSLSRRLKMSQLRSPRCVVSTTVGYGMKSLARSRVAMACVRFSGRFVVVGRALCVLKFVPDPTGLVVGTTRATPPRSAADIGAGRGAGSTGHRHRRNTFLDGRLALDEIEDLVLEDHTDEHLTLLRVAVF